jgi:hypothetical protein
VASGRAERIGINGEPLTYITPKIPAEPNTPGPLLAYRVAMSAGLQFHGLFRRRVLVERELWIRPTVENIAADMLWIFAVAHIGQAVYVDDCTFWKRYYPNSAHKKWHSIMQPGYVWNFASVACSYLDDYAPTWAQRLVGKCLTYLACGLWAVRLSKPSWVRRFNARDGRYTL